MTFDSTFSNTKKIHYYSHNQTLLKKQLKRQKVAFLEVPKHPPSMGSNTMVGIRMWFLGATLDLDGNALCIYKGFDIFKISFLSW